MSYDVYEPSLEAFLLTHFHSDHYNGLLWAAHSPAAFPRARRLKTVLSPGLPSPSETLPLLRALFSLSAFSLGGDSGIMEVDFRAAAMLLKGGGSIEHFRLFQGHVVPTPAGKLHVIWPPRSLSQNARRSIANAVREFEELFEDPEFEALAQLYQEAREYIDERFANDSEMRDPEIVNDNTVRLRYDRRPGRPRAASLDQVRSKKLRSVNDKLRRAANYCCIAFTLDDRILCLSDLDKAGIDGAVSYLAARGTLNFETLVAPHHGTVWSTELLKLRAQTLLISVGERLWPHVTAHLGTVAGAVHATYLSGDHLSTY